MSERPHRVRTWAPIGQTPVLHQNFRCWKNASLIAGITQRSFYFKICPGAVRGPFVITFLKHLLRHLRSKLLVVWDGAPIHRSRPVKEFLRSLNGRVLIEQLPAYAPELNPAEGIFGYVKERKLGNLCPHSIHQLTATARKQLSAMRRRPKLIAAWWKLADLC
jgi:transposase